ncbi:phosphatidylinositol N-acetylglucosaminyltransferase subunit H-like [Arctopsyche grandis]|uniref:phosphatidylinositol N-acetylglucosaminyltransferase subunit H-like n=1 Tax=Arctopsyche grandis TaxID=121162 RepID=UPI00406D871D
MSIAGFRNVTFRSVSGGNLELSVERVNPENGCRITLKPFLQPHSNSIPLVSILVLLLVLLSAILPYLLLLYCIAFPLLYVAYKFTTIQEETALFIPTVGLQYTKKYASGYKNETFINWCDINSVIINEVIYSHKIIYVLTIIVENQLKNKLLFPMFMGTMPRLECLEIMYQELSEILDKQRR